MSKHSQLKYYGNSGSFFSDEDIISLESSIEEEEETRLLNSLEKPRLVIRGPQIKRTVEKKPEERRKTNRVIIDWFSFTSKESVNILEQFAQLVIPGCSLIHSKKPYLNYQARIDIVFKGQDIGMICFAMKQSSKVSSKGQDRNLFSLTGQGCKKVDDWSYFYDWLCLLDSARITRIDHALDIFDSSITDKIIMQAYESGKFKLPMARTNPKLFTSGGRSGDNENEGMTRYIGDRQTGRKFARCYEKGYEQIRKLVNDPQWEVIWESFINGGIEYTSEDGEILSGKEYLNWYRIEIVNRSSNCVLPLDMLINSDEYFSTAYPFCEEILKMNSTRKPSRLPSQGEIDLLLSLKACRDQYGKRIIDALLMGQTNDQIVALLSDGLPMMPSQKMIKSGLLFEKRPDYF